MPSHATRILLHMPDVTLSLLLCVLESIASYLPYFVADMPVTRADGTIEHTKLKMVVAVLTVLCDMKERWGLSATVKNKSCPSCCAMSPDEMCRGKPDRKCVEHARAA